MRSSLRWAGWGALTALSALPIAHADEPADAGTRVQSAPAATEAGATPATATDGCPHERFVILAPAASFAPALVAEVRTDLATELLPRGLGVCAPGTTERDPAARIDVSEQAPLVVIELDDRVTHKRVARDLSLAGIPENGRALAIAIAIDELLRASWAELSLDRDAAADEGGDEEAFTPYEPPLPRRTRRPKPPPRETRLRLAADLGFTHTAQDFDAFSLSARVSLHPREIGWLQLSVGGLSSLPVDGERGSVLATGLRTALTLGACTPTSPRAFGCGGVRGGFDWLELKGMRPNMAETRREHATVLHASIVGLLAVMLGPDLFMFGELSLGGVTKGARATDGSRTLMGVTGLLLSLHLGVGIEL